MVYMEQVGSLPEYLWLPLEYLLIPTGNLGFAAEHQGLHVEHLQQCVDQQAILTAFLWLHRLHLRQIMEYVGSNRLQVTPLKQIFGENRVRRGYKSKY
jgi:hypothetical protein